MTLIDAVKVLVDQGENAVRSYHGDISREEAERELPKWVAMRKLRELDDASADEVTHLVLCRFPASEPPAVPGLDFFAVEQDAQTLVAETLGKSKDREYTDREGDLWIDGPRDCVYLIRLRGKACTPVPYERTEAEEQFGPLVEVTP